MSTPDNRAVLLLGSLGAKELWAVGEPYAVPPVSQGARLRNGRPRGEVILGCDVSGQLTDLTCADPEWWDALAKAAAQTADAIRVLVNGVER